MKTFTSKIEYLRYSQPKEVDYEFNNQMHSFNLEGVQVYFQNPQTNTKLSFKFDHDEVLKIKEILDIYAVEYGLNDKNKMNAFQLMAEIQHLENIPSYSRLIKQDNRIIDLKNTLNKLYPSS